MGDPLRTVVEAPTKLAAVEAAARRGFSETLAHPVTPGEAQCTGMLPEGSRSDIHMLKKDGEHITTASSGPPTLLLPQRFSGTTVLLP